MKGHMMLKNLEDPFGYVTILYVAKELRDLVQAG